MKTQAVLFDVDGTLLDTGEFIFQAAEHTFPKFGLAAPTRAEIAEAVGIPLRGFYQKLLGRREMDTSEMARVHHEFQLAHPELSVPYQGVSETLAALSARGIKLGAVTNRHSGTTFPTLTEAGLMGFFGAVVCVDDVKKGKPDPELLFAALSRMRESADTAAMVGDSSLDIEAGKAADVYTVRATYGFNQDNLHDPEPDAFINAFTELLTVI